MILNRELDAGHFVDHCDGEGDVVHYGTRKSPMSRCAYLPLPP